MDELEAWTDFNVAMMGATAALAGLAIVAASVNISEIIKAPAVAARLAVGIAGLGLALVGSSIGLIPQLPPFAYGVTMIVLAAAASIFPVRATMRIFQNRDPANRLKTPKSVIGFVAPASYLLGGILLIAGDVGGLVWFAVGAIAAILAALLISWVALVEVLR